VALMPVADALAAILAGAEPMPEEMVALDAAHHRVLARDVAALRTQPPQAMSAMDGYAVRSADAAKVAARLKVIGEVAAGRPFDRTVGAGEAVRIFTGGVIPDGADAVIIQEDTVTEDGGITITEAARPGRHIRPAGIDFSKGDVLLSAGTRLTDRDLSLAAGMNYPDIPVRRRPKVAVLATGDELVMPGSVPGPGEIVYSNGYAVRAIGLPGNPVSSYVCGFLFLAPLIRALSGRSAIDHVRETALLGRDVAANDLREDYLRARLERRADGVLIATPVNHQDSSLLGNLAAARALIVRSPFAPAAAAGTACEILRLPD